jgi:hypothetical protein
VRGYWQQKIGSLLGLFTILLVVFAPLVSQTLRADDPAALALSSFCSVSHDNKNPEQPPQHGLDDQACAYCGLAMHFPALPSGNPIAWRTPQSTTFAAVAQADPVPLSHPVRSAQPRGPPVSA